MQPPKIRPAFAVRSAGAWYQPVFYLPGKATLPSYRLYPGSILTDILGLLLPFIEAHPVSPALFIATNFSLGKKSGFTFL